MTSVEETYKIKKFKKNETKQRTAKNKKITRKLVVFLFVI